MEVVMRHEARQVPSWLIFDVRQDMSTYDRRPEDYITGSAPPGFLSLRSESEKDLVELWYVKPLERMKGDEAFVCLMLCFPLIEAIIRYQSKIPDEHDVKFSDNSPALKWFATFMSIPEAEARATWDGLRNGLLHRAMIKIDIDYELTGAKPGRNAEFKDGKVVIYVWQLRDSVVSHLRRLHKNLWKGTSSPLPRVYLKQ